MTQLAYNGIMSQEDARAEDKRITLRLAVELWRELRMEAARRDVSTTRVINLLLKERIDELNRGRGQ